MIGALIERIRRDPSQALAWVIATGFGTGLSPVAPGTVGSLAALGISYLFPFEGLDLERVISSYMAGDETAYLDVRGMLVSCVVASVGFFAGVWAANAVSSSEDPDPHCVVWDEFVGMWVTCFSSPGPP